MSVKNATLQVRIPQSIKKQVEQIIRHEGFTSSMIINFLYADIARRGKVPFSIQYEPNEVTANTIRNARKGKDIEVFSSKEDVFNALQI